MEHNQSEQFDPAIADRLGKLRTMPVDISRLAARLRMEIPAPGQADGSIPNKRWQMWIRPLRAVAASLLLLAVLAGILVTTSGGPVLASPMQMAQLHEDMVAGRMAAMEVDSVAAANKSIQDQWAQSPRIPSVPQEHVMACCVRSIRNKKVACVLLKGTGEPVTMTVADATDLSLPDSPTAVRDGIVYHVQSTGSLNMVMTVRDGRWICLIGRVQVSKLMDLASGLGF
jgi:hypothetical protein